MNLFKIVNFLSLHFFLLTNTQLQKPVVSVAPTQLCHCVEKAPPTMHNPPSVAVFSKTLLTKQRQKYSLWQSIPLSSPLQPQPGYRDQYPVMGTRPPWGGFLGRCARPSPEVPRLIRLRVRVPSAGVASSRVGDEVFSTAFMFSCSAASSA